MTHLRRVETRFVFRRRVPEDLRHVLNRRELVRSLGSCSFADAQQEARRLAVASDRFFSMLKDKPGLPQDQIDELARTWFRERVTDGEQRVARLQPDDPDDLEAEATHARRSVEGYQELLKLNDWPVAADIADDLLKVAGLSLERNDPAYQDLCRKVLRGTLEAARLYAARHDGDYAARARDPLFSEAPPPSAPLPAPQAQAVPVAPKAEDVEPVPTVAKLIELHLKDGATAWTPQTVQQNTTTFQMFMDRHGNAPLSRITRRDVSGFLSDLKTLPSNWGRLPRYRGKPLATILEMAGREKPEVKRLAQKTINRHASALSGMWRWARKHGYWSGENPAENFIDKRDQGQGVKRRPWSPDELRILFASPIWAGCEGKARRHSPGRLVIKDSKFWLPLIALHTGLRLEEIAKLREAEVRQDGGLWLIDVVGNEAGRVKEAASNRTVPMHPELVRLGLPQHVESIRRAGGGSLWPELKPGGPDGKFSDSFTRWFGRYANEIGVKSEGVSFHSFRHNVGNALRSAGVPESVAADILGHAHKAMAYRVYGGGATVAPLYEALCKIDFGLNLKRLHV